MKKRYIVVPIVLVFLLASAALLLSSLTLVKTTDDVKDRLMEDLKVSHDDGVTVTYLGEYTMDQHTLLWFTVKHQGQTLYARAVECQPFLGGWSRMTHIYEPTSYAQDIVHVVWNGEDVVLMNNPDCKSLVYQDDAGNVVATQEFSSSQLPYVFILSLEGNRSKCDFLDATGSPLT